MKTKRLIAFILAVVFTLSAAATPALAAAAEQPASALVLEEENDIISIRIQATGELVYGSPYQLEVKTNPEDAQYIGVVMGVGGEAKGYVSLMLSDKIRILLKMIPLPKKMSKTPDQTEEFNVYSYLKQLIDGNDVSVLLRVADEAVSVMDVLHFYVPTIDKVSGGLKLALESRDINTAGVAMFRIKPKTTGVRMYWAQEVPDSMTLAESKDIRFAAVLESDGAVADNAKITYTYKKKGLFGATYNDVPTQPGTYTQTAKVSGNYSCSKISRTIVIR